MDATPDDVISWRAQYSIVCGDCLEVTRTIPDESIDSMVTDPPYFLTNANGSGFMGQEWDSLSIVNVIAGLFFRLSSVGSSTDDESAVVEGDNIQNPSQGTCAQCEGKTSFVGSQKSPDTDTCSAVGLAITLDEALGLSRGLFPDLTSCLLDMKRSQRNVRFVLPCLCREFPKSNTALTLAVLLRRAPQWSANSTGHTSTEDQLRTSAVTVVRSGTEQESSYTPETNGAAGDVASTAEEKTSSATTSLRTDFQMTIHKIASLPCVRRAIKLCTNDQATMGVISVWWHERWATQVFRVLKPGGHALAFGGTRTYQHLVMGLELAGFEIRDSIHYTYGVGFPKSLNVSLAIDRADGQLENRKVVHSYSAGGNAGTSTKDKGGTFGVGVENSDPVQLTVTRGATERSREWDGFGTALKPGHEPIVVARKPFKTTLVENVMRYGCGALNIDACRVSTDWNEPDRPDSWKSSGHTADASADKIAAPPGDGIQCHPGGRWPANVLFTHSAGCVANQHDCVPDCPVRRLGEQSGESESSSHVRHCSAKDPSVAKGREYERFGTGPSDPGTAARFFNTFEWHPELDDPFVYLPKPPTSEREAGCGQLRKRSAGEMTGGREEESDGLNSPRSGSGRGGGRHNHHPTLKSIELMSHLIRLVTRPGGVVLSMFLGSGTDVCAAILSGFRCIGIELNPEFAEIARARALYWSHNSAPPKKPLPKPNERQISLFGDP